MSLKNLKLDNPTEDVMYLARIAESSEQYDDMIDLLKPVFEQKTGDISLEERNVLCVAYKNAVGMRRIAWRAASNARKISKYQQVFDTEMYNYVKKLEEELVNLCKDMLNLITKHLLPKSKRNPLSQDSEVFFLKL